MIYNMNKLEKIKERAKHMVSSYQDDTTNDHEDVYAMALDVLRLVKALEMCIEQKSQWVAAFNDGDEYINQVGSWKILEREDEELAEIFKNKEYE